MTVYGFAYDSTTPRIIPATSRLNMYYFNGNRGPHFEGYGRGRMYIDVTGAAPREAFWADVETGDIAPEHAPARADQRHAAVGDYGGIYCNRSTLPRVQDAMGDRDYLVWLATLDGSIPTVLPSPGGRLVMVQCYGVDHTGANYDMSAGIDQAFWRAHAHQ